MSEASGLRLDKWLWYARFFKSRSLATQFCNAGKLRVDGAIVAKAHHLVRPGNVLTFVRGTAVRVVRVVALGSRRGPASEAQTLYEDMSPPMPPRKKAELSAGERDPGSGRPTKRDRRALDKLRGT
jgi:ribosome-associated heat shock protein Hsp15